MDTNETSLRANLTLDELLERDRLAAFDTPFDLDGSRAGRFLAFHTGEIHEGSLFSEVGVSIETSIALTHEVNCLIENARFESFSDRLRAIADAFDRHCSHD